MGNVMKHMILSTLGHRRASCRPSLQMMGWTAECTVYHCILLQRKGEDVIVIKGFVSESIELCSLPQSSLVSPWWCTHYTDICEHEEHDPTTTTYTTSSDHLYFELYNAHQAYQLAIN